MRLRVAVLYNQPGHSRSTRRLAESEAVLAVLNEVKVVGESLRALGHTVVEAPLTGGMAKARSAIRALEADAVFNLFEGYEDDSDSEWRVAEALEARGIPFTGNPSKALRLALNKARAKEVMAAVGIPVPRGLEVTSSTPPALGLSFPLIVKPSAEDASLGLTVESVVHDGAALERQVERIVRAHGPALVEEFVPGREFNVGVLGNRSPVALPVSEIRYNVPAGRPAILTYADKWDLADPAHTPVACPAPVDAALAERLQRIAFDCFHAFGCRGYARVDMRLDAQDQPKVLDVNPNPDISPNAGLARQAQAAGLSYEQLIKRVLTLAVEKA